MNTLKRKVAILGSTGSIGTQAIEVIIAQPEHFEVELLAAHNNAELLIKQAIAVQPNAVVIGNEEKYLEVKEALLPHDIKVFAGAEALEQAVAMEGIDVVLTAMAKVVNFAIPVTPEGLRALFSGVLMVLLLIQSVTFSLLLTAGFFSDLGGHSIAAIRVVC